METGTPPPPVPPSADDDYTVAPPTEAPQPAPAAHLDDPLEGLEGLLPAVSVPVPGMVSSPDEETPSPEQEGDAALLARVALEPVPLEPPRSPTPPPAAALPGGWLRGVLALLLLLAVIVPVLTGGRLDDVLKPLPGEAALAESIADLSSGDTVLVAFDYGPSASAELDPLISYALSRLAERSVRIVALSTRPEGVDLARQALTGLADRDPQIEYGRDWVVLGYLAGDAAGLRTALVDLPVAMGGLDVEGNPLSSMSILSAGERLSDLGALLLLTDDGAVARRWVEQVGAWTDAPLMLVTTAAAEPLMVPYAASGQLTALVSGALGGLPEVNAGVASSFYSADGFAALWLVMVLACVTGLVQRYTSGRAPHS